MYVCPFNKSNKTALDLIVFYYMDKKDLSLFKKNLLKVLHKCSLHLKKVIQIWTDIMQINYDRIFSFG